MSFDTKSLLAKLMATENITVEQKPIHTAYFDVLNRILVVPTLDENISPELYDLFMGHEVGHALYTPADGMKKAKEENQNMSIINVVEDARIEKKIKYKYPGLKNSFVKAYQELMDRDFFETKEKDLNQMNLIDRINMHFKGGATLAIRFNEEERELVKAVDTTETYDDVVEVSKRILDYMKQNMQEITQIQFDDTVEGDEDFGADDIKAQTGENFDNSDDGTEQIRSKKSEKTEEEDESEEESSDGSSKNDKSLKKQEKNKKNNKSGSESSSNGDEEIKSETDEAYKKNENKLFADKGINYCYADVPEIDPKKVILDYKQLYELYQKEGYKVDLMEFAKFRKESNKVVSYLVKEFEMRKNADQLKRASTSKTGELNLDRIYSYQFNEDLFKKITVVPNGKSHGLVMFLDWSGSMVGHIGNTMKQLFNLVMFCKKVNIPYEVFIFLDEPIDKLRQKPIRGTLFLHNFGLYNILSSRMSPKEFSIAGGALMYMTGIGSHYRPGVTPDWMKMSGTPLNESIIAAMEIVPEFKKKNKLQVVNTIFLTDGEGSYLNTKFLANGQTMDMWMDPDTMRKYSGVILRDPKTMHQVKYSQRGLGPESQTVAMIKLLKRRTNSNVIGFYVTSGNEFRSRTYDFFGRINQNQWEKIRDEFRKNKYFIIESSGFDEYYVLRSNGLDTDDDSELVVKENATTRGLVSAFSKYAGGRINNRVILNRFIGLIA